VCAGPNSSVKIACPVKSEWVVLGADHDGRLGGGGWILAGACTFHRPAVENWMSRPEVPALTVEIGAVDQVVGFLRGEGDQVWTLEERQSA
jgi:hypothetical protein